MRGTAQVEMLLLEVRHRSFPEMHRKQNQMIWRKAELERGGRGLHAHLSFLWKVGNKVMCPE